jgi:protein-disulfide isomerase
MVGPYADRGIHRMNHRAFRPRLAGLIVGIMLVTAGHSLAGESKDSVSRDDLVSAVERDSGTSVGLANASVVMVAFSDYQCTYCRKFWRETFPQIRERYIRTGKVRLVHRHLAILGEASVHAAQAASCAENQGKFWEYHESLFKNTSPFAFTSARLMQYAGDLKLDEKAFNACLESKKYAQRVEAETILGRALGATGTPTFLLNGQLLIGAYPFATFQQALDGLLASPSHKRSEQTK